ncbi:unnamed protein product [Periconia digitata]|uniref:Zn(2)-C6 fungal-type domain-containing protein n=1 Tax=Periconia digitata TaxID=1303443 RepID=A0A9W4UAA5_9PLEO|nr:unnamed protein product [Periconia digitata]
MNEHTGDTPPSPKRKKARSKYAQRACVTCRRSKLKCSGENPCQRCAENGKRCFYSEEKSAAEALQTLSRPTPSQPPLSNALPASNGNGINRRSILPRHDVERRASDASVLGLSMEGRMARIESMMEMLIQERTVTPRMSAEREEAITIGDAMLTDPALQPSTVESFFPSFVQQRPQSFHLDSSERPRLSVPIVTSPPSGTESPMSIRLGSRTFAFPPPVDYHKAVNFFFADLSPYYPCINEADFRMRSERMLATPSLQPSDVCFLALSYMVLACADIAVETTSSRAGIKPAGWSWFQAADELLDKKVVVGQGDLTMIQYLLLKTVYLTHVDEPDAAYNTVSIACRLCFQLGIHQQSSWRKHTPFDIHMQQRIFWVTYVLDKLISLGCGRPYCIRESDVDTELAAYLCDKDLHPDRPLPDSDAIESFVVYLNTMVSWSQFAAEAWDNYFSAPTLSGRSPKDTNAGVFSARLIAWTELSLPMYPLLPDIGSDRSPEFRQLRQHTSIRVRLAELQLLLYRQSMLSLRYTEEIGRACGQLAIDIVQRVRNHTVEPNHPSSFRFTMATALGHALLIFTTLLVRDLAVIGLNDAWKDYADAYEDAVVLLQDLSTHLAVAARVVDDFASIAPIVKGIIAEKRRESEFPQFLLPANVRELLPYTSLDFAQQSNTGGLEMDRNMTNVDASMLSNTSPLEFEIGARRGRCGVLWI